MGRVEVAWPLDGSRGYFQATAGGRAMYDSSRRRRCTKCKQEFLETPEHFGQVKPGQVRPRCRNCEKKDNKNMAATMIGPRGRQAPVIRTGIPTIRSGQTDNVKRQHGMCLLCAEPL